MSIYSRQVAVLYLFLSIPFKLHTLPALLSNECGSSCTFIVGVLVFLDSLMFIVISYIISNNGIEKMIKYRNNFIFKVSMLLLFCYFSIKLTVFYCSTILFIRQQMFEFSYKMIIAFTLAIPIIYSALKGVRTIARTGEILVVIVGIMLAVIFTFFKCDVFMFYNLPVITKDTSSIFKILTQHFMWFGDGVALLLVKVSKKKYKISHFVISGVVVIGFIMSCYILMNGIYGKSLSNIHSFLVNLASFNRFSWAIGRLDWLGIVSWTIMAVIYLSIYAYASGKSLSLAFTMPSIRKSTSFIMVIVACVISVIVPDGNKILFFSKGYISYFIFFCNYIIPLILLLNMIKLKKPRLKNIYYKRKERV